MTDGPELGTIDQHPWSVEQLIDVAERIMASSPGLFASSEGEGGKELNIRLIRDYVVREIIPRPHRAGRESRFGLAHLIQLLAVRQRLKGERWSLPAIKSFFGAGGNRTEIVNSILSPVRSEIEREFRLATEALCREARQGRVRAGEVLGSPVAPSLNPAQDLIRQFKQAEPAEDRPLPLPTMAFSSPYPMGRKFPDPPSPAEPPRRTRLHLELGEGCELVVDAGRIGSLTPEDIERLAEALKARLKKETER